MTVGAIHSTPVTVFVRSASIQFTTGGKTYNLPVPDGNLVFSSSVTTATTSYDSVNKLWTTYVPAGYGNPGFLSGVAFPVPAGGLPGGINPVSWTGSFCTDNTSASLVWKWAAAVYTSFNTNYNALGVKSDAVATSQYNNGDPAGSPENYKASLIAGATGNGSSFVGGYSGTSAVTPCLMYNLPIANAGSGQTVSLGSTVQLNGTGSTDPEGNPITYSWSFVSKPAGSQAALSSATSATPTFVLDAYGSYTVQLIVNDGKSSSAPSTVIINTKNTAPVANAGPAQSVPTQTKVQLDGSKSTDVDGDPLTYQWSFVSVPSGSTAILSNPTTVNPTFVTDKVGSYVVQLIVNDGHQNSSPAQVTITDSFVPPTANAGPNQSVEVESIVQLDGSRSTDLQGYPLTYNWSILSVPAGSTATLSDPHAVKPSFKADLLGNYVIQLTVNDTVANSSATTVTISTNDVAPVANPGPAQTVNVATIVMLDGTQSTDSDGQPLAYSWSMTTKPNGSNAALISASSAKPSLRADLPGTYVIQLIVNDGFLNSQPATVIISTNDVAPVANPGPNQTVTAVATVQLDGTGSTDSDGQPLTFKWAILSQPSGGTAVLSSSTAAKPTFVAGVAGTVVVQLIVNDGFLDSAPATMTVTVNPAPQPPSVSAGPNQTIVLPVNTATLSGSATSTVPAGSPVTVQWTQVSGPGTVTFANPTQAVTQAGFPGAGTYVVQLAGTVTATSLSSSAQATITVSLPPPPIANAGPNQSVIVNQTVQLDGSASADPSNLPLTYQWLFSSVPSGSAAVLAGATSAKPTFVPDTLGVYQVQLVVNNGFESGTPAAVQITVTDVAPTANAGSSQTVTIGATVQLNGSGSTDVDGHPLTYLWTITNVPQGSAAALSNPNSVTPTFVVDRVGNYTIQLVVNDGFISSQSSTVAISTIDSAPVANAGPNQSIIVGTTVQLDGSGSTDVDSQPLTYLWSFVSVPAGSNAILSSSMAVQPTFFADVIGTYKMQLIVNDGFLNSPPATVTVTTGDVAPIANAGPAQNVPIGAVVTLDGTASSSATNKPLTYQWALLSKPATSTATLSLATTPHPTFTADVSGTYVAQLIVNDGYLSSQPVTVMVSTIYAPPVANPGATQTVKAGTTVNLDGSGSTDPENFALTYKWAILSQPSGGTAALSNAAAVKPSFIPNVAGVYVVQLIVNDGVADSAPATVTITVMQTNQPPTVSAGPNQTIELPVSTVTLNGSATSSAPAGSPVAVQWTQVSGPGIVTFASATSSVTQATFPVAGTYVVQLTGTVTATGLSSSAQATITVAPINQPPVVTVGPDQTITFPVNTANLTGTASDDGFPVGSTLQISWSKVVGPGTVTFSNPAHPNTPATFSLPGNYVLRLSASDGQYTASGTMAVAYVASSGGGITVSAGADQVIVFPTAVTLSGSAADSVPGSTLLVSWSLVSGPGTATFANPASPNTTVTFSALGVYDLRLTATDGTFTATSDVKIYAGNVQCTLSNKGTDFWLMFTGAVAGDTQPERQLSLFISSDVATSGSVSVPGQGLNLPFSTTPGQVTTVNLPLAVQMTSSDIIEGKGIHVTAQNPVAVYGLNFVPAATDGYLGLPTNTLGTSYLVASYQNTASAIAGATTPGTEFGITATQDNTNITVVPTANAGVRQVGVPFTVQLNQGQTYQLKNDRDYREFTPGNGPVVGAPVDLTGSVVTSDKPIAVFGGHNCTFIPDLAAYCNSLVEQLPPVNLWGQNFVTMPIELDFNGDTFRFIAQRDGTHVQVNHKEVAVLLAGQFFEQIVKGPAEISADNPILVVQYANSTSFSDGNGAIDPTMIVVPPFEQFGGSYTLSTPTSNFPNNYINVIAPTSATKSAGVLLDGAPIPSVAFTPIGTSPFSGAQLAVAVGVHTLTSGMPFGVWSYGFSSYDNYGYAGGVCLASGVTNTTLTASPKTSTDQITSQQTIQATVKDASAQPVGGAGVKFAVVGVNPQSGFATTDANGVANFSYTGLNVGSDLITITSGTASDTASVIWVSNKANQPPLVNAGPNLTISLPANSVFLNGSVTDDGLPVGGTLTEQWSQLSGPAVVSFTTPNQAQTRVTLPQAGTYVLQLTANDSQLSSSSSVTVMVFAPNAPPVVSAGPDKTFVWVVNGFQTVTLSGTATDDGLPAGSTLTVAWSMLSGPNAVRFSAPNSLSTAVTFLTPGIYVFQLAGSDGQFTSTSDVTVNALGPIAVSISSPQLTSTIPGGAQFQVAASVGTPVQLTANVTVNGQPVDSRYTFSWQADIGSMTFSSPTSATTNVTFSGTGTNYLFVTVAFSPVPGDSTGALVASNVVSTIASPPTVSIAGPIEGGEVTHIMPITGTVSAGSYTLDYARQDDFNPLTFTTFATGTGPVTNGTLGTFDPTLLLNGTYVVRLTAINGSFEATSSVTVSVTRNVKVGVFTVSFNDLTVPVAGVPIQIVRSYDSRDKGLGDFGVGWRLSLADVRLQKSRDLSSAWAETVSLSGPFQIPTYCLDSTNSKIVTITFPGGKVYRFQAQNSLECQNFGPIIAPVLSFMELPGPANTAGATLTPADGGGALLDGSIPGPENLLGLDGTSYNPTVFVLHTADGTGYTIDQKLGLTSVTDTNGNTLTITPNGITSSAGKSVPFVRDDQGRIVRITDPDGNTLSYAYDRTAGDLLTFTDGAKNTTAYLYDGSHDMTEIVKPDGKLAIVNSYDASGRLVNTTDPTSFRVNFTHNIAAQTEVVQDRNGNSTTYAYDADGNVIQTTDPLGNISGATYDANDNKLTETNALGKTSIYTYDAFGNRLTEKDPLGNTTTYTYNAFNKPLTITDANNNVTTNAYDTLGNLLTTRDPLGNVTTNTYGGRGLLSSTTDPLHNTTSFTYDGSGNLQTQTDANGTVTSYVYDANGNRTSQSVTRTTPLGPQTLTTTYVYDGANRLVKTINPDNTFTQVVYNSAGQQATTIDALNHTTSYSYDPDGRLAFTGYPDHSNDATTYDKNGNRTQYQARGGGLTTTYTYDALNRLTQTQNIITGTTKTSYDAAGQVQTTTDANNNVTTYAYDDAGRRSTVTDALNHVTTFGYDGAGNQTTIKDANNNITTFTYDGSNRRTKVTYPDGKFESTGYDALGRVTSRTDANGVITQYNYDPLGRLTSVVQDAASGGQNLVTGYTYDEVGNRLTQTDANAHTTSYVYDQRGRRTQRTLPLGQSESYAYDADGNLQTRTDFNGKTTTYTYNVMNQVLSKIPDPSFNAAPVTFTYETGGANIGLRQSMTDATGTTNYLNDGTRMLRRDSPVGTVSYGYDPMGNVLTVRSQTYTSTVAGTAVTYTYDKLNRLSTVSTSYSGYLSGTPANGATSTYAYDNVGNLQSVTYPNGVVHNYTYDTRNRLRNLGVSGTVSGALGAIAGYTYTLDAAGHRTGVSELSGRTVGYTYDNLYRLTSETIASDPNAINGAVTYTYDAVGNRKQMTSSLAPVPAGLFNYDANDRFTAGDTYDNDGNTVSSGGIANVYDFENHLIQQGGATIKYDGDGNRVFKTVAGLTTGYLLDDRSPTGYVQVLDEVVSGGITRSYVYGLELIEQGRINFTTLRQSTSYNVYDGHGSVRALTDLTGTVTDTYDYDAFGNIVHSTGTTPNNYLFAGEQFDPDLRLYYNRARYLNVSTGRFWTMDTFFGDEETPLSLHKYLYAQANPVDNTDSSGHQIDDVIGTITIDMTINVMPTLPATELSTILRGLPYQVVVVTEPAGRTREPESVVKNSAQARVAGVPVGTPIRIAVPPGINPQAMVDKWRSRSAWNPRTWLDFERTWSNPDNNFKVRFGAIYDAYGNFEFGATGAAAGFSVATLELAADVVHGGTNDPINQTDIAVGFYAIKDGGTLSTKQEKLVP